MSFVTTPDIPPIHTPNMSHRLAIFSTDSQSSLPPMSRADGHIYILLFKGLHPVSQCFPSTGE